MLGACSMVLRDASLAAPLQADLGRPGPAPPPLCAPALLRGERRLSVCAAGCMLHHIQGRWWVSVQLVPRCPALYDVSRRAYKVYRSRATVKNDTALSGTQTVLMRAQLLPVVLSIIPVRSHHHTLLVIPDGSRRPAGCMSVRKGEAAAAL